MKAFFFLFVVFCAVCYSQAEEKIVYCDEYEDQKPVFDDKQPIPTDDGGSIEEDNPDAIENCGDSTQADIDEAFAAWMVQYAVECVPNSADCIEKKAVFQENFCEIALHNLRYEAGEETYQASINELTGTNFENLMLGLLPDGPQDSDVLSIAPPIKSPLLAYPLNFDLREQGTINCIGDVKYQGYCANCYCFGAIAGLEYHFCKIYDEKIHFSEQQCVDCTFEVTPYNNMGCTGGRLWRCWQYYHDFPYPCLHESEPYCSQCWANASSSQCADMWCPDYRVLDWDSTYYLRLQASEDVMMQYIYHYGAIMCEMDCQRSFSYFSADQTSCSIYQPGMHDCDPYKRNHVMLVAGWGYDEQCGMSYWIIKNSWGVGWGMDGYIRVAKVNNCGLKYACRIPKLIKYEGL